MEQKYAVNISGLSDISELCRLCLTRTGIMHPLYSISENEYCTLFDKLQRLSAEPMNKSRKYPSYLCLKCVCTVNLAYLLTEQLTTTHQQLTEYFQGINDEVHKGVITDTYSTDNLGLHISSKSRDSTSYNENNCGETNLDSLNHSPLRLEDPVREEIIVSDECIDVLTKAKEVSVSKFLRVVKFSPTDPLTGNIINVQDETNIKVNDANEKLACIEESGSHLVRKRQFLGNSESAIQVSKKIFSYEEGSAVEGTINSEDLFGDNAKDTQSAFSRLSGISNISRKKCRESFSKQSRLMRQNHRRHQHQLNITCNICSKSYPNLKALTGHVKLKHEGMFFECQKCMKKFKSSCTFKNHINGHTIQDIYADENNTIKSQVTATDETVTENNLKVMGTKNLSETVENITNKSNEFENSKNTPEIKHSEREVNETETKENEPSSMKNQPEVNVSLMETKRKQQTIIQPERNKTIPDHELETEKKENTSEIHESKPERKKHTTRIVESIKAKKTIESKKMGSSTSAIKESKTETQKTATEPKIHMPHEQTTKHIAETKEITSVITNQNCNEKENATNSKNNKTNKKKGKNAKHKTKTGLVKPHKCEHCSKNFSTKFKLQQHRSLHKKESNICDVCGVGFVSKIRLEIHRMKYPGQAPCGLCVETFINSRYLSMHMQLLHSTKSV